MTGASPRASSEEAGPPRWNWAGFDIAKPAVRHGCEGSALGRYAVASSFHQPVRTGWADVLLNCFSPLAQEEFLRVLRPGGRLIYACRVQSISSR